MPQTDPPSDPQAGVPAATLPRPRRRRVLVAAALVAAFALGGGAAAFALRGRQPVLVTLTPAPIATMQDWRPVAVKGQVAEIFGNKFIVQDDSGRALVETGPEGEGVNLVAKSETVTVQGRFERGFIHALAISHADGRTDLLGPPGSLPQAGPSAWRTAGHFLSHWFNWHAWRDG